MENNTEFEIKEGYVVVTAHGKRNLLAIIEGTKKLNEIAEANNVKFALVDYRDVIINTPLADAFNLVKLYEQKLPRFSESVISLVVTERNLEIARFWESVCHKRGYQYKLFTDYKAAENWLTIQIEEHSSPS